MSYTTTSLDGVIATDNIETAQQVIDAIASQGSISTGTVSVSSSVNTDKLTISGDLINSVGLSTNDIKFTNSATGSTKIDNILTLKGNTIGSLSNNDVIISPNGTGTVKTDNLQFDGNTISSTDTNGNLILQPNGTGNVVLGTLNFNADQTVSASEDDYILKYDHSSGTIGLEAENLGGGSSWTTASSDIYRASQVGIGANSSTINSQLMVKDTGASHTAVQVTAGASQTASVKLSRGLGDWSSAGNETIGMHLDTNRLLFSKLGAPGNNLTNYAGSTMDVDVQNYRVGIACYPNGASIANTLQIGSILSGRVESLRISSNVGPGVADTSIEMGVDATSTYIQLNDSSNAPRELQVRQGTNGNVMIIDSDGDVGINTASPTAKLHITASSGKRALEINGDPGSGDAQTYMSGGTYGLAIATNNTSASYYGLSINNSSTNTFVVLGNGQVGIGNNAPTVGKLNVNGYVGGSVPTNYYTTYNSNGGIVTQFYNGSSFAYSLYCSNAIGCNGVAWTSDERIKTEITVVDDAWALQKVRDIECKEYHYKDPFLRKEQKTIGFIAQDIKQHLPQAVSEITDYIPDELRQIENITWTPTDGGFKVIIPNITWKEENTRMLKFYVTTTEDEQEIKLELKADENNAVIFEKQYSTVFLYGKEVNNFLQIAKDKIYSLHHSAIQEIDRIQVAHKNKISTLEARMAALEQRLNGAGL